MTLPNSPADEPFVVPSTAEALERLRMPMVDAMRTQRAVRRLRPEPVPHDLLVSLLELSLKARLYRVFNPIVERMARGDEKELRGMRPGQWQAENFEQIPVFVIPCYRRNIKHRPVGRPQISVSSFYGSVYPAVQNLLLECRAVGLGASLQTLPIWYVPKARKILGLPRSVTPVCIIPIGWAKGRYGPTTRMPIGEVIHLDHYGNQPFRER